MSKIKELHLFKIRNDSALYPIFYVEAENILDATVKAKAIVDSLNNKRNVGTIYTEDIPLLELEEENENS